MNNKNCQVCGQKTDMHTSVHKNLPFVDNRNYYLICFTCYFVPKILQQKYAPDGSVSEEIDIPYCCENLYSAKELYESGSAETLSYAKKSVEAVKNACLKCLKDGKKQKSRPKASWNIC